MVLQELDWLPIFKMLELTFKAPKGLSGINLSNQQGQEERVFSRDVQLRFL